MFHSQSYLLRLTCINWLNQVSFSNALVYRCSVFQLLLYIKTLQYTVMQNKCKLSAKMYANPWIPVFGWSVLYLRTVPNRWRIKARWYNLMHILPQRNLINLKGWDSEALSLPGTLPLEKTCDELGESQLQSQKVFAGNAGLPFQKVQLKLTNSRLTGFFRCELIRAEQEALTGWLSCHSDMQKLESFYISFSRPHDKLSLLKIKKIICFLKIGQVLDQPPKAIDFIYIYN